MFSSVGWIQKMLELNERLISIDNMICVSICIANSCT